MVSAKAKVKEVLSAEEQVTENEWARLKELAERSVLSKDVPDTMSEIPGVLRGFHGGDIIKKNAPRKTKLLFVLPGALSLPAGGRVGEILDVQSRNPKLMIEFPTFKVCLRGTHVQPKNSILAMKAQAGKKKTVVIQEVFQSVVAFTEWDTDNVAEMENCLRAGSLWRSKEQEVKIQAPEEEPEAPTEPNENGTLNPEEDGAMDIDQPSREEVPEADAKETRPEPDTVPVPEPNCDKTGGAEPSCEVVKVVGATDDSAEKNDDENAGSAQDPQNTSGAPAPEAVQARIPEKQKEENGPKEPVPKEPTPTRARRSRRTRSYVQQTLEMVGEKTSGGKP